MSNNIYIPKKLKWDTLGAFKRFLENETKEKIVSYNGYELITETTEYGLADDQLRCRPIRVKKESVKETLSTKKPAISVANEKRLAKVSQKKESPKKKSAKKAAVKTKKTTKKKSSTKKTKRT